MKLSFVILETTPACNLNCRYCYNTWKRPGQSAPKVASYKQLKKTLSRLFKMSDVGQVTFSGGEPFLTERFLELVLFTRLRGKNVNIITNGNQASPQELKQAQDLGVALFELPLHSPTAQAHDAMTAKPGSWQRSLDSIKHLLDIGARVTGVVVLTRLNAPHVAETLQMMQRIGIEQVMFNRFNVGGNGVMEQVALTPTMEELAMGFGQANAVAKETGIKIVSGVCTPLCILDARRYPKIRFSACDTDVSRRPLTLDPWGNLRFCNHSPVNLGNIFEQDLAEMFSSDYVKQWQTTPEFCQDCNSFARCMGGCRAAAEQLDTAVTEVDPVIGFLQSGGEQLLPRAVK